MLALHPRVVDVIWSAIEPRLPQVVDDHPLGCHRRRVPDRTCFEAILFRLVAGCSWDVAGRLGKGSETTLRRRRTEWLEAGVFDGLVDESLDGYDRIIGLDLSDVAVDGSQHKAPFGGEGTGPNPVDRGKRGWKWSIATDRNGIPIGWEIAGANRNDCVLLEPTLDAVDGRGLIGDIGTFHLDRGYDNNIVRRCAPTSVSTICSSPSDAPRAPARCDSMFHWGCAGRSSAPTAGCRTSVSSAGTPTGSSTNDSPSSPSPSHSSSRSSSSSGPTAGAHRPDHAYRRALLTLRGRIATDSPRTIEFGSVGRRHAREQSFRCARTMTSKYRRSATATLQPWLALRAPVLGYGARRSSGGSAPGAT